MIATNSNEIFSSPISPLLIHEATVRTGDTQLPGSYWGDRQVWLVNGAPIVETMSNLAELSTKTEAQLERDDSSEPSMLELLTKTMAQVERDD